jgi:DNA polymerase-3 subunit beta
MKFTIDRAAFLTAVSTAQLATRKNPARIILRSLRLTATPEGLHLTGTDNQIFVQCTAPAEVATPGDICADVEHLRALLGNSPDGPVTVSLDDNNWLTITAGACVWRMPAYSADEFPDVPEVEGEQISIPAVGLCGQLRKTLPFTSSDETRAVMCSVYLESSGDTLTATATDGHRLATVAAAVALPEYTVVVPKDMVKTVLAVAEGHASLALIIGDTDLTIAVGSVVITRRRTPGAYPRFRSVIPQDTPTIIGMESAALTATLRRVAFFQSGNTGVALRVADGALSATAENPEKGEVRDEFTVDYDGPPLEVSYNPKFLLDLLAALDSDRLTLALNHTDGPGVFRPEGNDNETFVLMPLRAR